MTTTKTTIRQGQLSDLTALQNLFVDTVKHVCHVDYDEQQIKVWTSSIENRERWLDIVTGQFLLVAQNKYNIVGFCSLDRGNYVDFLYVHKDYQGQGIAKKLYSDIEREAINRGQSQLTADVSITARPFFEKVGFKVFKQQLVIRKGIELTNFKMIKELAK